MPAFPSHYQVKYLLAVVISVVDLAFPAGRLAFLAILIPLSKIELTIIENTYDIPCIFIISITHKRIIYKGKIVLLQ